MQDCFNFDANSKECQSLLLPLVEKGNGKLEITALENWLSDPACTILGVTDAPKFKDFILPLIFYKR